MAEEHGYLTFSGANDLDPVVIVEFPSDPFIGFRSARLRARARAP
jgi:hypothetical protein